MKRLKVYSDWKLQLCWIFYFEKSFKGYLHYKTITSQNVSFQEYVKNFFISQKSYVPFSRYSSFCIFNHPMIYQICEHETGCIFEYIFWTTTH